jgi:hypothetical protein
MWDFPKLHGNYCGPQRKMGKAPKDLLDAACFEHDLGYAQLGVKAYFFYNDADERFLRTLRKIKPEMKRLDQKISWRIAHRFFSNKKLRAPRMSYVSTWGWKRVYHPGGPRVNPFPVDEDDVELPHNIREPPEEKYADDIVMHQRMESDEEPDFIMGNEIRALEKGKPFIIYNLDKRVPKWAVVKNIS